MLIEADLPPGIFRPMSTALEPETELRWWSVWDVKCAGLPDPTRHFVGETWDGGRVCSPIQSYDPKTKVGISRSGRHYKLVGAGKSPIGRSQWVWENWKRMNRVKAARRVWRQVAGAPRPRV